MRSKDEIKERLAKAVKDDEKQVCEAIAEYLPCAPAEHTYALLWMLDMAKCAYVGKEILVTIIKQGNPKCAELAERLIADGKILLN